MTIKIQFLFSALIMIICACNQPVEKQLKQRIPKAPSVNGYYFENAKKWLIQNNADSTKMKIVFAINRTDSANFTGMDSVIIPNDLSGDLEYYLPFPVSVEAIKQIKKIVFFSYPAQVFAAYANGVLIYTGPVNMGRKKDQTPTGLFYANWKAEKTTSTFNDEWELRWNFNIENKLGVGWHQYSMPGYPASHSCLRLQEMDARNLYAWADQWELDSKGEMLFNGTPVIIFGNYNFDLPKPWLQLIDNAASLKISIAELEKITKPYQNEILKWQQKREQQLVK